MGFYLLRQSYTCKMSLICHTSQHLIDLLHQELTFEKLALLVTHIFDIHTYITKASSQNVIRIHPVIIKVHTQLICVTENINFAYSDTRNMDNIF